MLWGQLKVFFDGGDNHGDQLPKLLVFFSFCAVQLVVRLEVVDIHVADHRFAILLQQAAQALLDRHVAGEQGQRVGIARLLDLQLGDQLEHVYHPAHALIAAIVGDDEVLLDTLARATGQQAADFLQRLALLDGEKVVAHQAADRFTREQVGREGFEQGFG